MQTKIVAIGNSKGIRIPKRFLEEARLQGKVNLKLVRGSLVITPQKPIKVDEGLLASQSALAKEWDTPEEDAAWAYLQ